MAIRLKSAAKTDVGLKRSENEDNFIMLPDQGLYVLADGMGGHASGKTASTLAVTHIMEFVCVAAKQPGFKLPYSFDEKLPVEANILVNAIKYANERVFIESCKDRSKEGMGTTITAILASKDFFVLAHVGDSRIYRMRGGVLKQMTEDHSLLNHLISIGEVKPEDASKFANKNVILRAVGLKDYVDVAVQVVEKLAGDTYMMCSDGLSDLVPAEDIEYVMNASRTLPEVCHEFIKRALAAGGKDNVTVVCVQVEEYDEREEPGRWATGSYVAVNPTMARANPRAALAAAPPAPAITVPRHEESERRVPMGREPVDDYPPSSRGSERLHSIRAPRSRARNDAIDVPMPAQRMMPAPPPGGPRKPRSNTPPAPMDAAESPPPGHLRQGFAAYAPPPPPAAAPPEGVGSGPRGTLREFGAYAPEPAPAELDPIPRPKTPAPRPAFPSPRPLGLKPLAEQDTRSSREMVAVRPTDPGPTVREMPALSARPPLAPTVREFAAYPPPPPADDDGENEATVMEMPAFRPDALKLARPSSGEARIEKTEPSIVVDESMFDAPKRGDTIVVDDSLFEELVEDDDEPTVKPPPLRRK
ncbi:MAG: Stp1/IreP family PP2C-type Ser/Thr phosphatase [Myxococcota bacterium]|jgi:protein phosphatase|nr:Stp1/IreP family PP2C-type Ser/Thr phosphatase [Myxococcota bacterium]